MDAIGTTSKGAQRWLDLGFIRFQPSEIVKLAVPLMVAVYLGNRPLPPKLSETFIAIAMIMIPTLLVAIQPDLGTSILVSASGLFVVFLAGMSWWLILAAVIGLAGFIPIMWLYLMHDYQRTRVLSVLAIIFYNQRLRLVLVAFGEKAGCRVRNPSLNFYLNLIQILFLL